MKRVLIVPALLLAFQSQAANENLDQLLSSIKADIQSQRLSSPAGNNALERITAFREQAPFDFRVVPLTYQWGEAYVALANKAIANGQYGKAQGYLDKVWYVASLTPGLEEAQAKIDAAAKGGNKKAVQQVAKAEAKAKGPSKAELARQKKIADELAKEKARLEAERKRQLEQAKKEALAEKKRLEAELKRKQEEERKRRLAAAKAEKEAAARRAKAAQAQKSNKPAAVPVVAKAAPKPAPARKVTAAELSEAKSLWAAAKENTAPLASYPISSEMIANRDRDIAENLEPVCKAILDNDASVVLHTTDKADYRWLTVRLTLCLRRLDKSFRLRHSHQLASEEEPFVTLHPPRGVSLVRKVEF